jgi:hypothetical protein
MEFGVFTLIIPDSFLNSIKKYINYEVEPDENSQLLFTYDDEPEVIKEFDMKTSKKIQKTMYSSRRCDTLYFQTKKGLTLLFEDVPHFSQERGISTLKSLKHIFHKHNHWSNYRPSTYNCVYYIHEPAKKYVFSILKISSNRYLFAYEPIYLSKTDAEQIVFELFF